ncbi:MAG: DMT family transporter [Muribaculaceae bacterium]|jgi:drug/metabolite transporter (DMT)-like permease|nr:DMT family transporter [Muribaculaceae bacterium]
MTNTSTSIFQRPAWVVVFALTAAIAWGWAYPLIKLGFDEFGITTEMTGSKMLFAGIRFAISGFIILTIARSANRQFAVKAPINWLYILIFALMNTTLHYACFYIGLSHSEGARAAILNSLGVFLLVLLACLFFKTDRLTTRKILGCAIGFAGILALNIGGANSGNFTLLGDGMIILNALCSAVAGLMTRGLSRRVDVFVGTGYSLAIGGVLLVIPGIAMGGTLPHITFVGIAILAGLICISTLGFALYNKLLSCNPVGKVAIFNSLIPVVGAITSCLCLHEPFYWKYIIAATLATAGIYIINKGKR